jgi:hypothetical protein
MARDITDPEIVQRLFLSLDDDRHNDNTPDVYVKVREGGLGTTSASVEVVLEDPKTCETALFRVSITRPEPGDDDYDGEEV